MNAQLAERAFSWSELLDRLESVIPPNVRITSVAPSFAENGLVHLSLQCEGKGADSMLVALTRLQRDPHFRDYLLFHEYFDGDDGSGVGANHQTGWTGLVAKLLQQSGE